MNDYYINIINGNLKRRRNVQYEGEEVVEIDRFHYNDPLGTIKEQGEPDRGGAGTQNGYVITAEGEPLPISGGQPGEENHIRFHGGFLEDKEFHTSSGPDHGHLYRMGVRHYSPALGRFLQRDAYTYGDIPSFGRPLTANPYIYGYNNPLMYTDTMGYQACCGGGFGSPSGVSQGGAPVDASGAGYKPGFVGGGVSPGGKPEPACAIPFPKECWCVEDKPTCCKSVGAPDVDPMCEACTANIPIPYPCPPGDEEMVTYCNCWCCGCRSGLCEDNSPSVEIDHSMGTYYYGPPRYGPHGNNGDRWWFIPTYPFPWPIPWPLYHELPVSNSYVSSKVSIGQPQILLMGFKGSGFIKAIKPWCYLSVAAGVIGLTAGKAICWEELTFLKARCSKGDIKAAQKRDCIACACEWYNKCSRISGIVSGILLVGGLIANFFTPWGGAVAWAVCTVGGAAETGCFAGYMARRAACKIDEKVQDHDK